MWATFVIKFVAKKLSKIAQSGHAVPMSMETQHIADLPTITSLENIEIIFSKNFKFGVLNFNDGNVAAR